LGDITHDGADAFDHKQQQFRSGLEAARKKKEQADSQLLTAHKSNAPNKAPTPAPQSSPEDHEAVLDKLGLGSFSTHSTTGEARQAETDTSTSKKRGAISNLIYGTVEGQQMDKDMEKSFSQVLARGKYVHSIVFHDVKPDKVDEYVELVGKWYPRMANMEENRVNLVGSWRTEVGDSDTFGLC